MINWKTRVKQPMFWVGMVGVIGAPVLAYLGISAADLTTWDALGATFVATITNPYLLWSVLMAVLGALGVIVDPTTAGFSDSEQAMTYEEPKKDGDQDA